MPVQKKLNLPIASRSHTWQPEAAQARIREWAGGDEPEWEQISRGFLVYGEAEAQESLKFGYCDIVDDKLTVVPLAVFSAAMLLAGEGADIAKEEAGECKALVSKWYRQIGKTIGEDTLTTPWEKTQEKLVDLQSLLFQIEYFIAHLDASKSRDVIAVDVLSLLQKIQDFQVTCPLTAEANELFFRLSYFFSHLDLSADFGTIAAEGLDLLKDVYDLQLLYLPPIAESTEELIVGQIANETVELVAIGETSQRDN